MSNFKYTKDSEFTYKSVEIKRRRSNEINNNIKNGSDKKENAITQMERPASVTTKKYSNNSVTKSTILK